jgi:hypothetical protein
VGGAISGEPLDGLRCADGVEASFDAVEHYVADHFVVDAAAGGGGPDDDLAVMVSIAKATWTISPFQQGISRPSDAQRWLESGAMTVSSWARIGRLRV